MSELSHGYRLKQQSMQKTRKIVQGERERNVGHELSEDVLWFRADEASHEGDAERHQKYLDMIYEKEAQ